MSSLLPPKNYWLFLAAFSFSRQTLSQMAVNCLTKTRLHGYYAVVFVCPNERLAGMKGDIL